MESATPWQSGRFDAGRGPRKVLFGRMYEDAQIELRAFAGQARVFCIASAGCTAMKLATQHEVVAVDINPVQLDYAARRLAGEPAIHGTAERVMGFGRAVAPLLGWSRARMQSFLDLDDASVQLAYWREHLDTRRFRAAFDGLLSVSALRAIYASPFLAFLPRHLGAVMRARMERCFSLHPNRTNPYARALFLGEMDREPPPAEVSRITLVNADAVAYLEAQPAGSFGGFTLSNILDGADALFAQRLFAAVKRAAAPGAVAVLRSFGEQGAAAATNQAAQDRSMLWGVVDVRPVSSGPGER